jgi:hypothetical protein
MKHLHIVSPYQSAAMIRMTAPLVEHLKVAFDVTTSETADLSADLNYHIPFHTLVGLEGGRHAMLYTHCNPGDEAALMDAGARAELIVCMSYAGRNELVARGVDPAKLWVIYAATDGFAARRRNIGIVGYEQPNGRKRSHILLDLAWQMDLSPFHFIICGGGWEPVVEKLRAMNVSVDVAEHLEWEDLQKVGYIEGGPLPLLEAMACGVPVIAPPVGYAADLLDTANIYNGVDELAAKLHDIVEPVVKRQMIVKLWDWPDYSQEHALIFGRLLGEKPDLHDNCGASRYAQLLDEIDILRPESIVEIGTWKGDRALQMIQEAAKCRASRIPALICLKTRRPSNCTANSRNPAYPGM